MSKTLDALSSGYRWNHIAFMVDLVFFRVAFTFINPDSVLPVFVRQVTDAAPVIGLITTVFTGGWLLPQLVVARLINDRPHKKPYLVGGMSGRVLFWVIGLALWLGLARYPTLMLLLFFVGLGLYAIGDGTVSVAWFDILARAIPVERRGRLLGISQVIGGLGGLGAAAVIGWILSSARFCFPSDYALIFALAGVAFIPSTIALSLIREPSPERGSSEVEGRGGDGWLKPLTEDFAFRRLLSCRILVGMIGLVIPFYVVYATDVLHLSDSAVGSFVAAQTLAQAMAGPLFGLVSERWGPRYVICIGGAAAMIGPLFAMVVHIVSVGWLSQAYPLVYVTLGLVRSTFMLGFFNYLLELAPGGLRPIYIGLQNTFMGVLTLAPIIGGWLLEATSYTVLFGLTAVLTALGFLFALRLGPSSRGSIVEAGC
jgi:MFS family permease